MKKICSAAALLLLAVLFNTTLATESGNGYISDLKLARELLEDNHGDLYENVSKDKLDKIFEDAELRINASTTIQEFYFELSKIFSEINDGHTYIMFSNEFMNRVMSENTYFPLRVKIIQNKMFCDFINESIPVGAEILQINGHEASDIMHRLSYSWGSETGRPGLAYKNIEDQLHYLYPQIFEEKTKHKIIFLDSASHSEKTAIINSEEVSLDKLEKFSYSNYLKGKYQKDDRILDSEFDLSRSTAVLRIFSFMPQDYKGFTDYIDKFFEDVKFQRIRNVIIDVRGNLGGDSNLASYVLAYIYDQNFYIIRSETLKNSNVSHPELIAKEGRSDYNHYKNMINMSRENLDYEVLEDGSRYSIKAKYKYRSKNNFDGNLFVLMDGGSFSCGSILPQKLGELDNCTLIGTETSGNYYEATAGYLPIWELPNSKIKVSIPLEQLVIVDELDEATPRVSGVKPDYVVGLRYDDFIRGIDTQMNFAYHMVK